jgi:hypothetical protein
MCCLGSFRMQLSSLSYCHRPSCCIKHLTYLRAVSVVISRRHTCIESINLVGLNPQNRFSFPSVESDENASSIMIGTGERLVSRESPIPLVPLTSSRNSETGNWSGIRLTLVSWTTRDCQLWLHIFGDNSAFTIG